MKKIRILCAVLALLLILPAALLLTSCGSDKKPSSQTPEGDQNGQTDPPGTGDSSSAEADTPALTLPTEQEQLTLYIGERIKLTPTVTALDSSKLTYASSVPTVADASADGTVVALSAGSTVITVQIPETAYKAFCIINVKEKENTEVEGGNDNSGTDSLTLNAISATLNIGQTQQLVPTLIRPIGKDRSLLYTSSSPVVATVSDSGLITAKAAGTTSITVKTTDGKLSATCIVAVNGDGARYVKLDKSTLSLEIGDVTKLNATYNTMISSDPLTLSFASSLPTVATVDAEGNVAAVGAGTAVITVSNFNGTAHATCVVTVKEKPKATLTLTPTTVTLEIGQSQALSATYVPARETDPKILIYSTSLATVATVDQSGKISAVGIGSAIITVSNSDGSAKATCKVTVTAKAVATLKLDKTTLTLNEGDVFTLRATYTPAHTGDSKVLLFSSSNSSVITVDSSGKITAKAAGIANVIVTNKEGSVSASCHVTVKANSGKEASLTLDIYKLSMTVGESKTLHTSYTPASEHDSGKLLFSSSDLTVVSVDENGKITAKEAGSAVITVTNETNSVQKTCTVTVKAAPVKPVDPVKTGSFKTDTGTKLNLLVEWSLTQDEQTRHYYLTANVYLESYSIVCGKRTNLSHIVIDGNEFKFNTEALDYTGVKEKQKIFFATATVIYEEDQLPETVGMEALWVFNGSYSGVSIPVLHAQSEVTLK